MSLEIRFEPFSKIQRNVYLFRLRPDSGDAYPCLCSCSCNLSNNLNHSRLMKRCLVNGRSAQNPNQDLRIVILYDFSHSETKIRVNLLITLHQVLTHSKESESTQRRMKTSIYFSGKIPNELYKNIIHFTCHMLCFCVLKNTKCYENKQFIFGQFWIYSNTALFYPCKLSVSEKVLNFHCHYVYCDFQ